MTGINWPLTALFAYIVVIGTSYCRDMKGHPYEFEGLVAIISGLLFAGLLGYLGNGG